MLYINLIMVSAVDLLDSIFRFSEKFATLQEFVFSIFIAVVISSILTYIYDKFKRNN